MAYVDVLGSEHDKLVHTWRETLERQVFHPQVIKIKCDIVAQCYMAKLLHPFSNVLTQKIVCGASDGEDVAAGPVSHEGTLGESGTQGSGT